MKKIIISALLACLGTFAITAKTYENVDIKYNRSSIYSILLNHTEQKFGQEIKDQFLNIPVPDQYNDHNLNVKVINVSGKGEFLDSINNFIENNHIASRMVGKWFDRNILTGECSLNMIQDRGIYNASALDHELAANSARGIAMLQDAGEQLIGQSFLLVNEIKYVDKSKGSGIAGGVIKGMGFAASMFLGSGVSDLTNSVGDIVASYKGFKVKITTHLYQLVWDDDMAGLFYSDYYTDSPDESKRIAFENNRNKFKLKYIGNVESSGSNTSFMGINESTPLVMVRKACQRALDENVVDLQKKYDQFKIKSPVVEVSDDKNIMCQIGLKEGITTDSKYEVLEAQEKDGRTIYKKVAVVKPVKNKIWDNRFMAAEEQAYGADFGATTFEKVSGGEILPGHLLMQVK